MSELHEPNYNVKAVMNKNNTDIYSSVTDLDYQLPYSFVPGIQIVIAHATHENHTRHALKVNYTKFCLVVSACFTLALKFSGALY